MPLIAWADELSVGVAQLDEDHRVLIGIINELYDAMVAERDEATIDGLLAKLKGHAARHFAGEESVMQSCGYRHLEDHKRHHGGLITQLDEFMERYKSKSGGVDQVRLLVFLQGWLINHIKLDDFQFKHFLKKSGLPANQV
jgi:hemerythrin